MDDLEHIQREFEEGLAVKREAMTALSPAIAAAGRLLGDALAGGHKVLACGNGGSAADAQHFASELVNRFETGRRGLPAVALTTDGSTVTSVANDSRFDQVFARQVEALGGPGDVLLALTTSGGSANVVRAIDAARARGMGVVALTGGDGGATPAHLGDGDVELRVPSPRTARVQEVHIVIIHCLCGLIDARFAEETLGEQA